jgi:hypothetical protein
MIKGVKTAADLEFPHLSSDLEHLRTGLANRLVEFGLYPKEADAMVETWRDSWFEEGMRLFYIVPQGMVDRVLPLNIHPAPSIVTRVFVGRIEIFSPATRLRIEALAQAKDFKALHGIGRFLGPFVTQMERTDPGRQRPAAIQAMFRTPLRYSGCVK